MKILCFTLLFALFIGFSTLFAQDPDTVWTHDISQYKDRSLCARFMPDGKSIIAGVGNSLYEFEVESGKLLRKLENPGIFPEFSNIISLEVSPIGNIIIVKIEGYGISSWDYYSGNFKGKLNYRDVVKKSACCYAFHPTENKLFMLLSDTIILFNLTDNKTEKYKCMPEIGATNIAVSKDGKYLALAYEYLGAWDQKYHSKLYLFDAIKMELTKELDDIIKEVRAIKFSNSGKYVAFTTVQEEDCFLRIYNLKDNTKELYPSSFLGFKPWGVLFSPDEKKILVSGASDGFSKLMFLDSGKIIYNIKHATAQSCLDINSNNQILFDEISKISLVNSNWYITNVSDNQSCMNNINISLKFNLNHIYINNIDNEIIKSVNIFDINGKLMRTYDAVYSGSKIELPFSAASGVYLARIVTAENDYGFRFVVSE